MDEQGFDSLLFAIRLKRARTCKEFLTEQRIFLNLARRAHVFNLFNYWLVKKKLERKKEREEKSSC